MHLNSLSQNFLPVRCFCRRRQLSVAPLFPSAMPFIATDPHAGQSTIYSIPLPETPEPCRSRRKRAQNRGDLREHMDKKLRE